jgi:hypothetical protein
MNVCVNLEGILTTLQVTGKLITYESSAPFLKAYKAGLELGLQR